MIHKVRTYRVSFAERQRFAITLSAPDEAGARTIAQMLLDEHGSDIFDEIEGEISEFEVEEIPSHLQRQNVLLKLALNALNTAPRFAVGNCDSYEIAAQIEAVLAE